MKNSALEYERRKLRQYPREREGSSTPRIRETESEKPLSYLGEIYKQTGKTRRTCKREERRACDEERGCGNIPLMPKASIKDSILGVVTVILMF